MQKRDETGGGMASRWVDADAARCRNPRRRGRRGLLPPRRPARRRHCDSEQAPLPPATPPCDDNIAPRASDKRAVDSLSLPDVLPAAGSHNLRPMPQHRPSNWLLFGGTGALWMVLNLLLTLALGNPHVPGGSMPARVNNRRRQSMWGLFRAEAALDSRAAAERDVDSGELPKGRVTLRRILRQPRGGSGGWAEGAAEETERAESGNPQRPPRPPPPPPRTTATLDNKLKEQEDRGLRDEEQGESAQRASSLQPPPPPPPLYQGIVQEGSDYAIRAPPWPGGDSLSPPRSDLPPPPYTGMDPNERGSPSWIAMDPRQYPPPPPPPFYDSSVEQLHQPDASYFAPPPQQPLFDEYLAQQRQQLLDQGEYYENQLLNLTSSIDALEQREVLRSRQLDAVTERILEVESLFASSQLSLKECQSNCTDLVRQRDRLQEEIQQLERQVEEGRERSREDAAQAETLKKELVAAKLQAEELALLIERHRVRRSLASEEEEDDEDEDNLLYRRSSRCARKKKKKAKQGFWAWLFGWGSGDSDDSDDELGGDLPDIDDAYATARSTLLTALQSERSSVHELEAIVASLQQNNSAISEQVKSRDLIVDELNDRIAVFEEDKMVLKAALKQLQKDLNAEAPKTQQLVQNFEAAQAEVKRLKKEIKGLIATHQEEVAVLREAISKKEDSLAMTESNLTVIGTYVDRLEGRLAEFALVRREIELREAKCRDIEQKAEDAEKELAALQARVKELQTEHEELRTLMRELAEERAKLLSKNQDLTSEIKSLKEHDSRVQESLGKLNSDYGELVVADMALQHKLDKYEKEALESAESKELLKQQIASTESNLNEVHQQLASERSQRKALLEQLQNAEDASKQLELRLERVRALNEELSQNASRFQEELTESLSQKRSTRIGKDDFSIHLSDVNPTIRPFDGKFLGSTVRDYVVVLAKMLRKNEPATDAVQRHDETNQSGASNASFSPNRTAQSGPVSTAGAARREVSLDNPPSRIPIPNITSNVPTVVPSTKRFRKVRKAFAQATGIHGAFTNDYKKTMKQAQLPQSKGTPSAGSSPGQVRIPPLAQSPLQQFSQKISQIPPSRPNSQAAATSRVDLPRSSNSTKRAEATGSLLKPGYPVFGRQQGASVPPAQRQKRGDPPAPPPPPPVVAGKLDQRSDTRPAQAFASPSSGQSHRNEETAPHRTNEPPSKVLSQRSVVPKAQQQATTVSPPAPKSQVKEAGIPRTSGSSKQNEPRSMSPAAMLQSEGKSRTGETATSRGDSPDSMPRSASSSVEVGVQGDLDTTATATTPAVGAVPFSRRSEKQASPVPPPSVPKPPAADKKS